MSGSCVGCPSAAMTLFLGLEQALRDEVPGFEELMVV
jgi:Fe-S cluster biogenesis protein NfuA